MPRTKKMEDRRGARYSVSFSYDTDVKLDKLGISCGMSKSELIDFIVKSAINDPTYVSRIQKLYNRDEKYLVLPVTDMGKIIYK